MPAIENGGLNIHARGSQAFFILRKVLSRVPFVSNATTEQYRTDRRKASLIQFGRNVATESNQSVYRMVEMGGVF